MVSDTWRLFYRFRSESSLFPLCFGGAWACFSGPVPANNSYQRRCEIGEQMQLHLSTWPEVEAYLAKSKAILIPIGSTEQHGPNGLLGTDALCPEIIGKRAGDEGGFLI